MISWIQNLLQKHYKWLFTGLLAIIIVAFVFTIGNTGGVGSGNPQDVKLEFYGVNLNSPRQMQALQQDTSLSARLNAQRLNRNTFEMAVLQRITALHLANQLNIPAPTQEQMASFIRGLQGLQDPQTGQFSRDRYTALLDELQNSPQSGGEQALLQVVSDDYRISKVQDGLSGPGYVLPYMAKLQLEAVDTVWSLDVATLERNNFQPDVQPSEEELASYYEENEFRFATGPRIVVSYVAFPLSDYLADIEDPKPGTLLNYYRVNRSNFPAGEDGKPQPLDAVREQVVEAWKQEQAEELAINDANTLAVAAYEASYADKLSSDAASIRAFAEAQDKEVTTLAPFPRDEPRSSAPGIPQSALAQAATLDENRFYTDGLKIEDGAAVFFLEEELPSSTPPLAEIRETVLSAYVDGETRRLFSQRAQEIKTELQAAVDAGESFAEKAKSLGLKVDSYADFTFVSPPQGLDYFVLQAVQGMKKGGITDLMSIGDLGTFVYVADKVAPQIELDSPEVQENIEQLANFSARATSQGIMNELIIKEEARVTPSEF